jgi:hypothetical protein
MRSIFFFRIPIYSNISIQLLPKFGNISLIRKINKLGPQCKNPFFKNIWDSNLFQYLNPIISKITSKIWKDFLNKED